MWIPLLSVAMMYRLQIIYSRQSYLLMVKMCWLKYFVCIRTEQGISFMHQQVIDMYVLRGIGVCQTNRQNLILQQGKLEIVFVKH